MNVLKIMVPLDGSAAAEASLPVAITRAKETAGARVVLVRAVDPNALPRVRGGDARTRAMGEAAEYLQKIAWRLRRDGLERVGRAVWLAPFSTALAEAVRTVKPDLIVMSAWCGHGQESLVTAVSKVMLDASTSRPEVIVTSGHPESEHDLARSPA